MKLRALLSGLILGIAAFAHPQQSDETNPAFPSTTMSGGVDNVNLYNGDSGVAVPLGPAYPLGPAFDGVYSWQLHAYNTTKIWSFLYDSCSPDSSPRRAYVRGKPTLGAGWTLELGHVEDASTTAGASLYVSPDGGRHELLVSTSVTQDGSRLQVKCTTTTSCTVDFPNGITHIFTHSYSTPRPTVGSSPDFSNDLTAPSTELGLTSITNKFGTLLTVNYLTDGVTGCTSSDLPHDAWKLCKVNLQPGTSQARTISFTWGTQQVAGAVTWPVLTQIQFPSAQTSGNDPLNVAFAYDGAQTISRNAFDSANVSGCTATNQTVYVPFLQSMTFSDATTGAILQTEGFGYYLPGTANNYAGELNHIDLPAGGTVDYTVGQLTRVHAGVPTELESSSTDPPPPLIGGCGIAYYDYSGGIGTRVLKTSATDTGITTTFTRDDYRPSALCDPNDPDRYRETRRVLVTEGNGDGTNRITKYLFHVSPPDENTAPGIELERRYYADTNFGGNPVRTIVNCFEDDNSSSPVCGFLLNFSTVNNIGLETNVRQQASVTWYGANLTGGGSCSGTAPPCTASISSAYNSQAFRYGTSTVASTLIPMSGWTSRVHTCTLAPNTASWLLDICTPDSTTDNGAPAPSSLATTLSYNTTTGFLNSSTVTDATYGTIQRSLTPDALGNATTSTVTGSSGINGTFTDALTYQSGLLTSSKRSPFTWKQFDVDRDIDTGVVTFSRDPNALSSKYNYDALGRLLRLDPAPQSEPTLVFTRSCYRLATDNRSDNASNLNITLAKTGSSDANGCAFSDSVALTFEATQLDGLGRVIREFRLLPNDQGSGSKFALRDTNYDSAGHVKTLSEWYPCVPNGSGLTDVSKCAVSLSTNSTTHNTTSAGFDVFGRPTSITKADGTVTSITRSDDLGQNTLPPSDATCAAASYTCIRFSDSLQGVTQTVNGSATTVTRMDPLGRLIKVTEPAVGGTADTTSYTYNVRGLLAGVTQGSQSRTYVYDQHGFLRSETNPENETTSYSAYDALGDVRSKTEGASLSQVTTTYSYDTLGRLSTLSTNEAGGRTYVQNTFDTNTLTSPPSPNYPKNQLTQSIGSNFPLDPGPAVKQQFGYGERGGRLSSRLITIGSDIDTSDGTGVRDGEGIATTEAWTYNTLGQVDTYNHPRAVGAPTFQEDPSYANGLPSSANVGGTANVYSTVTYLPFGGLKSWKAQNNVVTTIAQATNLLPRPATIATSGATTNFSSGTYAYDGGGNITAIGADTFKYDGRSRLVSADYGFSTPTCADSLGNANRDQCYSYDRYGNLTGIAGFNPRTTLATSTATNHVTAQAYDTRGNMTSGGLFDGLNRLTSSSGWNYLFDASGERIAKFPSSNILRREMSKLLIQARGEAKSSTPCYSLNPAVDAYYDDVACSDPDRGWIDKTTEDLIAQGFGNRIYGPGSNVTRAQMAKFIVLARGETAVDIGNCPSDPNNLRYSDVPCSNTFWGYIEQLAIDLITFGCGDGTTYCPSAPVDAPSMMAFMSRGWPGFKYIPRGTQYTLRDAGGRLVTELWSTAGSTSYPTNDFPVATTPVRDNVFLGNLLVASNSSNTLGGATGWSFYHADHLGTPRLITGVETTNPVLKYWPYGDEVSTNGITSERLKFATMERDGETSHFYDHARTHDFSLGRFVSVDPLRGEGPRPGSLNRYTFTLGNPLLYVDPLGLYSETITVTDTYAESGLAGLNDLILGGLFMNGLGSGDSFARTQGGEFASASTSAAVSPCDWLDRAEAGLNKFMSHLSPGTASLAIAPLNIAGIPLGGEFELTAYADGSVDFYAGGGVVVGIAKTFDTSGALSGWSLGSDTSKRSVHVGIAGGFGKYLGSVPVVGKYIGGVPVGASVTGVTSSDGTKKVAVAGAIATGFSAYAVAGKRWNILDASSAHTPSCK